MRHEIEEASILKIWIVRILRGVLEEFWLDHIEEIVKVFNQSNQTDLLTIPELAKCLKLSKPSIYRLLKSGFPHIKLGKGQHIRVRRTDLEAYVNNKIISNKLSDIS